MKKITTVFFLILSFHLFGQSNSEIKLSENASLIYEIQNFAPSNHSFKYCENIQKYLCKIDDKDWYGADYSMDFPQNEFRKLELILNGNTIVLETNQMYNPNYSGTLNEHQFKLKDFGNFYRLYGFFSDGAGTYTVHWKIMNQYVKSFQ